MNSKITIELRPNKKEWCFYVTSSNGSAIAKSFMDYRTLSGAKKGAQSLVRCLNGEVDIFIIGEDCKLRKL